MSVCLSHLLVTWHVAPEFSHRFFSRFDLGPFGVLRYALKTFHLKTAAVECNAVKVMRYEV